MLFFLKIFSSDRRSAPIFNIDRRSGLQGSERSQSTVLPSDTLQFANFVFWTIIT